MSDARTDRPQPITFNHFDLAGQLARLRADAPIRAHGRDSLSLVRDPALDLVLVVLNAGARMHEHKAPGPISVIVLDGRVAFTARGQRLELGPHSLVTLPNRVLHEVEALEDSAILITIAGPIMHTDPAGLEGEREANARQSDERG